MNEAPLGLLFFILFLLILCSAFFSSSETSMMALNRYRLKHLRKNNHRGAIRASELLDKPDRLIGLILIGNNLVNIFATIVTTAIAGRLYGETGIFIGGLVLVLVILIFAEVTPKTIAAMHPERLAFPFSLVLKPLMVILYPAVWLTNHICNGLLKLVKVDPEIQRNDQLSQDELRTVVNEAGTMIPDAHQRMLLNILDLEKVEVDDIMVPRAEVYGIDLDDDDDEIVERLQSSDYTRVVVYREDIDKVEGLLHLRNATKVIDENGLNREALAAEMREPYFVPSGTPLHTQMYKFQEEKRRLGVVVDEYGVFQGLVTLEDILEEIVGEFTSNIAENEDEIFPQEDGSYIIDGTATIRDINKSLNWNLPADGPKTLNGLIMEHLESFPDANVSVHIEDYYFEIIEICDNIIQRVKARK